jgi:hypothetical protein
MFRNIAYSEILRPSELGVILSYQCNAECKHCLYACGREWADWMTIQQLREALEVLSGWGHDFQVHHTGGEPFMNFPLLLEATKLTRKAGEVLGYSNVGVYQTHCIQEISEFAIDETVPIEAYVERYGAEKAGRMFWGTYGLIDSGRASYTLDHLTRKYPPERFRGYNCRRELLYAHHSHFDLYGNYISWFCGGLRMGSWRDFDGMVDRYERRDYPELTGILISDGPYDLCRFARDKYGYSPLQDGYVGKCHLCVDVRKYLSAQAEFAELQPSRFYNFVSGC